MSAFNVGDKVRWKDKGVVTEISKYGDITIDWVKSGTWTCDADLVSSAISLVERAPMVWQNGDVALMVGDGYVGNPLRYRLGGQWRHSDGFIIGPDPLDHGLYRLILRDGRPVQ